MVNIFGLSINRDGFIDLMCSLCILIFALAFILTQKQYGSINISDEYDNKKRKWIVIRQNMFFIITLGLIVISSLKSLSSLAQIQQVDFKEWWQYLRLLVDGSLILIVVILVKLIVLLWIASVIHIFLEDPATRGVYKINIFGFTISANTTKEYITNLSKSVTLFSNQLEVITKLNTETVTYLGKPFEDSILNSDKIADKIRHVIFNVLYKIYYEFDKNIRVYVVPIDQKEEMNKLDGYLIALLEQYIEDGEDVVDIVSVGKQKDRIGIAVHYGSDDLNTAIIIDARDKKDYYEIAVPEICGASNLFIAVSTIISWAQQTHSNN